jgi:hypothetical protein
MGFTDHLQNVIASTYSAVANSHTLQFTTARNEPSQSPVSSLPGDGAPRRKLGNK